MGTAPSESSYIGGANLPPELIGCIGNFAEPTDRTRMRRTGRDAFAVGRDHMPSVEEFEIYRDIDPIWSWCGPDNEVQNQVKSIIVPLLKNSEDKIARMRYEYFLRMIEHRDLYYHRIVMTIIYFLFDGGYPVTQRTLAEFPSIQWMLTHPLINRSDILWAISNFGTHSTIIEWANLIRSVIDPTNSPDEYSDED